MAEPAIVVSAVPDILSARLRGTKEQKGQNQSRDHSPRHKSHCCILPFKLWAPAAIESKSGCRSTMSSYGFGFFTSPLPHPALNSSALIFPSPSPSTSSMRPVPLDYGPNLIAK